MQVWWGRSPALLIEQAGEASLERSWGRSRPSQAGSRQEAGGQAVGPQVQRAGTQGHELMPRKQGSAKASLLDQCSSP